MKVAVRNRLATSAGLILLLWLSAFALLFNTYLGIVDLWSRSDTYTHGYVVLPISLYLIWRIRARLFDIAITPQPLVLLLITGCLGGWLLGVIAGVQALQHLAAVVLLPLLVWGVMGNAFTRAILFPLGFLIFAVPIGDFLIEPMMAFTADFTVAVIRLLGIPVFREGLYFSLPSGNWSVVKACSGIRYIIASLTLGALFSYLTYQSYWKRSAFLLFSALVPVIANGIRAVIIVLIGHYSNMELATGADHLVYGWVFFGIVIFVMFWVGGFFADDDSQRQPTPKPASKDSPEGVPFKKQLTLALVIVLLMCGFRYWQIEVQRIPDPADLTTPILPATWGGWQLEPPLLDGWEPSYHNPSHRLHGSYHKGDDRVGVYVAYFAHQHDKSELVSSVNDLAGANARWRVMSKMVHQAQGVTVVESLLRGGRGEWLMWNWYQTHGGASSNRIAAKIGEVQGILTAQGSAAAGLVIYHPIDEDVQSAREVLSRFMESINSQIVHQSAEALFLKKVIQAEVNN